tara:strand:+ start:3997 stop:4209 length:213 start_codon:yes stop_codon:yes gene_type:complete
MASVDLYLKLLHEENVLKKRLSDNKEQQDKISKEVWKDCKHEWERCSDYDDLCSFVCKKCTLYNNPYFYT